LSFPIKYVLIDGAIWEFKSPKSGKMRAIERNLRKGKSQSSRVVFTSKRIGRVPDKSIEKELSRWLKEIKKLSSIKFINRHGKIIDIEGVDRKR